MSPGIVRWAGLAGSAALAVAAALGGTGFARLPSVNPVMLLRGDRGVLLPVCWVLGTVLLLAAWWLGRRVVPSTRWALVTVGLWALPVLPVLPLGSADVYSYACQGYVQFTGGDPYGGGVGRFGCPWLGSMDHVWWFVPAPYGPLFLLLAAGAVGLAGPSLAMAIAGMRAIALVGLALAAAALPVLARRTGVPAPRAVWTVLACPLVLVHLVSGAHNDALMVGLMLAGLAVAAAGKPSAVHLPAAGALLGLAMAVKATAVVVLPFALLAAVPPRSPWRALWRPGVAMAAGAAISLALVSVLAGRGLGWVQGLLHSGDTVAWTSPSTAVGLTVDAVAGRLGAHVDAIPFTRAAGLAVLVVLLAALWWRARGGAAVTGAGLALAAAVLCAPVVHPWYAIWPLAVLAVSRFAESAAFRRWILVPCTVAAVLVLPAGYNWALATRLPGAVLMTAGVLVLVARVVWRRRTARPGAREPGMNRG